jgi:hypothetical protein
VASVLSTQPELSASVSCYAGALRGTDSAEPPLQLRLDGGAACEGVLCGLLAMMAHCLALQPLAFGGRVGAPVLERCRALLVCGRSSLRAAAARFLAAAVGAAPLAPCSADVLLDTLAVALQRLAAAPSGEQPASEAEDQRGWWQQLLALLTVLLDRTAASPAATATLLPRIHSLAAAALAAPSLPRGMRQPYFQLLRATLLAQPALLEGTCAGLLQMLAAEDPCCRQLLLQCLEIYLHSQQQLCGVEPVGAVLAAALQAAGVAVQVRRRAWVQAERSAWLPAPACGMSCVHTHCCSHPQAEPTAGDGREEEEEGGRSARKRRRLRITPQRLARPAEPEAAESEVPAPPQVPGPGLRSVAAAVARLAAELRERCLQQQPGVVGALGLACLLGLLAPLAPREALALALPALLPALHPPGGGGGRQRLSMGSEGERLAAAVRLALATLQAGLVEGAAGAVPACVALAELPPPHLLSLLQRCWQGEGGGAAAAGDSRVSALCASVAALQADLLEPGDVLDLLQTALNDGQNGGGGGGAAAPAPALVAAALLPAAACIGGGKERLLGSQPRGTQGGRRAKQAAPSAPPLVAALLQLLTEPGQRTPQQHGALLAAAAQGLCRVVAHAHEPAELALTAAQLAGSLCRDGDAGGYAVCRMLLRGGPAGDPGFQPTLTAAVSEWVHQALDLLTAAELPPGGQAAGVDAVAGFLRRAAPSQLERSRPLARWLLRCAGSPHGAVRGALLRHAALLAEPHTVLALCHEGEHPTHSKDRQALAEACEPQASTAQRSAPQGAALQTLLLHALTGLTGRKRHVDGPVLWWSVLRRHPCLQKTPPLLLPCAARRCYKPCARRWKQRPGLAAAAAAAAAARRRARGWRSSSRAWAPACAPTPRTSCCWASWPRSWTIESRGCACWRRRRCWVSC